MDAKEAIRAAKGFVAELFDGEQLADLGLEEIERDGAGWNVTIGFFRPWNPPLSGNPGLLSHANRRRRTYRVVRVPDAQDQDFSIKIRADISD